MEPKIEKQIVYNNIKRFLYLVNIVLYISLASLITIDLINYINNVWEKFPSQYYLFLNRIISLPLLLSVALINKRYLKGRIKIFNYTSLFFLNILLLIPVISIYYYWEIVDYNSSGIFLIYIFVYALVIRAKNYTHKFLFLYFFIFYFGMLVYHQINYIDNPSLYINGLTAIILFYYVSKSLYKLEYINIENKMKINLKNKKLNQSLVKEEKVNHKLTLKKNEAELLLKLNEKALIDKVFIISTFNEAINNIDSLINSNEVISSNKLNELRNSLSKIIFEKEMWNDYMSEFEKVRPYFVKKLKSKHPDLSINELNHCIYVISNLNSKKVASMINISYRSVETARYRIKKRLKLKKEDNLYTFLKTI